MIVQQKQATQTTR